ncbi:hypothetical protein BCV70DRAFT_28376 [Testicularia cyperi]|uniref:Uncharacterized protein n=1 Tax=Testicularia cyperi TaxID=1882483 RepID=A0A317XL77_9BASI|nr:hypothetical protein BCV70DRAFT_28376 [Testicularia cyperi]
MPGDGDGPLLGPRELTCLAWRVCSVLICSGLNCRSRQARRSCLAAHSNRKQAGRRRCDRRALSPPLPSPLLPLSSGAADRPMPPLPNINIIHHLLLPATLTSSIRYWLSLYHILSPTGTPATFRSPSSSTTSPSTRFTYPLSSHGFPRPAPRRPLSRKRNPPLSTTLTSLRLAERFISHPQPSGSDFIAVA